MSRDARSDRRRHERRPLSASRRPIAPFAPAARREVDRADLAWYLLRVADGDRMAMTALYRLTAPKLNALLLRMLRDTTSAEEVLQDVYLTVWRRGATFDPDRGSPISWLVTITRNKAIDRLRAKRTRTLDATSIEEVHVVDPMPSVVDVLERTEMRRRLSDCLQGLESRQQSFLRAAFFEGLTYDALAVREDVPLGTMKSWIRRSLLRLRACLDR